MVTNLSSLCSFAPIIIELQITTHDLGISMAKAGSLGVEGLRKLEIGKEERIGNEGPRAYVIKNSEAQRLADLDLDHFGLKKSKV